MMNTTNGNLTYLGIYDDGKHTIALTAESVLIAIDARKDYIGINQQNIIDNKTIEKEKDLIE